MASMNTELHKQLKKNGWNLLRQGTKHAVFEKDGKTMLIPLGTKIYSRSYRQMVYKIQGKTDKSKTAMFSLRTSCGLS